MYKRRLNIPHVLKALFTLIITLIYIYIFASWVDIIAHNESAEPVYQMWNIFAMYF